MAAQTQIQIRSTVSPPRRPPLVQFRNGERWWTLIFPNLWHQHLHRQRPSSSLAPVILISLSLSLNFGFSILTHFQRCRGIRKMKDTLPPKTLNEKLPDFLQKCAHKFELDRRYRNDMRYLRIWLHLVTQSPHPQHILERKKKTKICRIGVEEWLLKFTFLLSWTKGIMKWLVLFFLIPISNW